MARDDPHEENPVRQRPDPANATLALGFSLLASIIGLLLLAWAVLFVTKGRFLKHSFERIASRMLERDVKVAGDFQLYLHPINIKFYAEGLTVSNPAWTSQPQFFQSKLIDTNIATIPLMVGTRRFNWFTLADGHLDLEWDKTGQHNSWTFGDPNAKGAPLKLPVIRTAMITGTTIRYRDPKMLLSTDITVDTIKAQDTRFASNVTFTGDGTIRAIPFKMNGSLLSPNQTVVGGQNQLAIHAVSKGNIMDVSGTLPEATQIEDAPLKVAARGPNLARLFDLIGVVIPDTRYYRINSNLMKHEGEWRFTGLNGRFGDSDLNGRMTVSFPKDRLRVDANIASNLVDIKDIGPFIGYNPQRLDAEGGKGAIHTVAGTPRILPDAPLRSEEISRFDAHVDYRIAQIRQEFVPISNIVMGVDLDHSLLKLSPLNFIVAGGQLTSNVIVNARVKPVFTDYDIKLAPTPLGKLLAKFGTDESGTSGVIKARIQMKGSGDTVRQSLATSNGRIAIILPKGTFWTRNIQLSELDIGTFLQKLITKKLKQPVQINCGLVGFTVRDGIAAADPILIDTTGNVIAGKGSFSFRDESIDMAIRADAKKFSLFSGQSPIGINGHFAAPGINPVSPQLLTRAGVAVGLGVVATPLAAVLAFVDIGDAKSAACGPILAGANAAAQRTTKGKPRSDVGNGSPKK